MDALVINILKLMLAIGVGAVIGVERDRCGKQAGMRTLSLVSLGSAFLAIITLKYYEAETARVLAGIITGIGFLGAGTIIANENKVLGLTTAATIWALAIVGMGIGMGEYILSIAFGALIYLILIERKIERTITHKGDPKEEDEKRKK